MLLKFETLNPEETYSEGDLKFDLTCLMAEFLGKPLKDKSEAKENLLHRLYAFIRMTNLHGLSYQSCLQENIHWLLKKKKTLQKLQYVLDGLLKHPEKEMRLFALEGMLLMVFEYARHGRLSESDNMTLPPFIKACMSSYFIFEANITVLISKNKSLQNIHSNFITLLQHHHPKIRLFAAQAILIAVYNSYVITCIYKEEYYPLALLQEQFLPGLLEQLNDESIEIRQYVACSLCFFNTDRHIAPQLLVNHAEKMLESDNPSWQKKSVRAFTTSSCPHYSYLSDAAVSRFFQLCLKPGLLSPWDRNKVLGLLSMQVRYSRVPLPVEIIEQCLQFPEIPDTEPDDEMMLAVSLLELVAINYHKQSIQPLVPAVNSDAIFKNIDDAEAKKMEKVLEGYSVYVRISISQGLCFLPSFQNIIRQFLNEQKPLLSIQNLLMQLMSHHEEGIRLFTLQSMLIMVLEYKRMEKLSEIRENFLPPLIKSLDEPNQALRNWAACSLCYLTDHTFPDLPLLQQYTQNLLGTDDVLRNIHVIQALLCNLEMQDKIEPLTWKNIEQALQFAIKSDCKTEQVTLKLQQLQLIGHHYSQHRGLLSKPIVDFVLQQLEEPELTVLAAQVCFIILLKVHRFDIPPPPGSIFYAQSCSFRGSHSFSKMLDILYRYAIDPNFDMGLILSSATQIVFASPEENVINTIVELYNFTITNQQVDDSIKVLLLLFEAGNVIAKGQDEFEKYAHRYALTNVQKMIESLRTNNRSLSVIYELFINLFKHPRPEVRLFAAKAGLIAAWEGCFIADEPDPVLRSLFLPALLEQLNDPCLEVRHFVAGSLCYFDIDGWVDPQKLVSYAENLLVTDNAGWYQVAVVALSTLFSHHHCILLQTTISRIVHLCMNPAFIPSVIRGNYAFALLNDQVLYSKTPLPEEILEQCLHFPEEQNIDADEKIDLDGNLLRLIGQNFEIQKSVRSLPANLPDFILHFFEKAELRDLAWKVYRLVILATENTLQASLLSTLFAKLRVSAEDIDPDMQAFVMSILNAIIVRQQEKDEILAIITQRGHLELHQIADVLGTSRVHDLVAKNNALERLLAFIKNTFLVQGQSYFKDMVPLLQKRQDLMQKMQNCLIEVLGHDNAEFKSFAMAGMLIIASECFRINQPSDSEENMTKALTEFVDSLPDESDGNEAIDLVLCLFKTSSTLVNDGQAWDQAPMQQYLDHFAPMITRHLAENKSLTGIQHLFIRLLQHRHPAIQSFAAKAILIAIHTISLATEKFNYPYAELHQRFFPVLVEKLNDESLEIRNLVACSLCYFELGERVSPQLLACYTEQLLETNIAELAKINIDALTRLFFRHDCFLPQTAIQKVVNLCLKPNFLPGYCRSNALSVLNFQRTHSDMPLTVEVLEQCLHFSQERDTAAEKKSMTAGLLRLIGRNFEKQEAVQSIPATISDTVLHYFDNADFRELAWLVYKLIILASGKRLQTALVGKAFPILRLCAGKNDPEIKEFVTTVLQEIHVCQQQKDEVLAILQQSGEPERPVTEAGTSDRPSDEKDLDTLLAELTELNVNNPNVCQLLTSHELVDTLAAVKVAYAGDSHYLPAGKPIAAWDVIHCQTWAQAVSQNKAKACDKAFQTEIIAVIMRASVLDSGQTPRNIQLISLLILLKSEARGCLAEVKTGEGKTKIVSMFAALKALQFDFVDVVSSSTILARRDAHETQNFFSNLGLTVADNIDGKDHDGKAPRACYSANVVYGDTNEYQWDSIYELMGEKITRGSRPFRILFFDEVDSLLVDRAERGAMINSPHPALEYVNHVIVAAWHMMVRIGQSIVAKDGQWVYQSADGKTETKVHHLLHFASNLLKKYIENLAQDPNSPILLPKHLKTFVLAQAEEFADAAVGAYYRYHENKHYLITDNFRDDEDRQVITIVDNNLTGEVLKNTRWTYLHSFLELKHGLKMEPPRLMGNFLSTPGLCKRYGNQIFGLTGTLGGADTQALLKEMYQLDLAFVPTYKPKCFMEYQGIVAPTKSAWLEEIIRSVGEIVSRRRPVLVIAATIADVIYLEQEIVKANVCRKITRFSRNDTEEMNTPSQAMEAGEVIIATLIAGRGIDWYFAKDHIDLIEERGGLHIMLTSLPLNLRVEQQIFGRTARKGNRGTAQLIINREDMYRRFREQDSAYFNDIETIRVLRDEVEANRVYKIKTQGIRLALLKDDLYLKFRGFINSIKGQDDARHRIGGIEEQWAYWLQGIEKKQEKDCNLDTMLPLIEAEFEQFIESMRNDFGVIRKNPCRQVQQGNLLNFGIRGVRQPDFAKAIATYTDAIVDDPLVAVQAYYNRAEARIFLKGGNYKDEVLADLQMAKSNLENHIIPQLNAMLVVHNLNPVTTNGFTNDFAKQIHCKIELLKLEIANIDQNISIIQQARHQAKKAKQKVDFEVCELKNLQDFFPDANLRPDEEIRELHSSGLSHLFSLQPFFKEKKGSGFGPLCVAFLGILQIVVGVLISYAAPTIGSMLIQEGINDIIYAARALISGNFDWNAYLANKVGSVSVTVISMGLEILKNSADLGIAAEAAKGQNALKNMAARQLNHEKVLEMAKKEVVKRVIDAGVREVFNFAVDKLTTAAMDRFSGDIEEAIGKRLEKNLNTPDCQSAMDAMLQLDVSNQNSVMQGQLDQMATKIMQEKSTLFFTIANNIIKGVLANQHRHVGTFLRIADMGVAFDRILQLTDNFTRKFRAELLFFYHQKIAQSAQISTFNPHAIATLKNQFYARITQRLTQQIIAIAKGQIIHPGIDMAMNEHLQNIANLIKRNALQPAPPEHVAAAQDYQPKTGKNTKSTAVATSSTDKSSSFRRALMDKRNAARSTELKEAFGKTLTVTSPCKPAIAPMEMKGSLPSGRTKSAALTTGGVNKNESLQLTKPVFLWSVPKPKTDFLYRGDSRKPCEIFFEGFKAYGSDMDIVRHVFPPDYRDSNTKSGYISTSTSRKIASVFPIKMPPNAQSGFLYEINKQTLAVDVASRILPAVERGQVSFEDYEITVKSEKEMAVPSKIKPTDIKGAWLIELADDRFDRSIKDTYLSNPHYQPIVTGPERLAFAANTLGRGVTALALAHDGMRLYQEYEQSQLSGNYDNFFRESSGVIGGWVGAAEMGITMGEAGGVAGAFLGPYGAAAGAIAGGIAGSVIGYWGGSTIGTHVYDSIGNRTIESVECSSHSRIGDDLPKKQVKLFDISKEDTSRHRFFLKSRSNSSQNESYQETALHKKHF